MNTRLKKILTVFLYCGFTKTEYESVKKDAYRANFAVWKYLHLLVAIIGLGSLIPAFMTNEESLTIIARAVMFAYGTTVSLLFFKFFKPESIFAQILIYISVGLIFAIGIIIGLQTTDMMAVTFIAFLVILPIFMIDKPYFMTSVIIIAICIYLPLAKNTKTELAYTNDFTNCVIFGVMGIILTMFNTYFRVKEFLLAKNLEIERTDVIREQKAELEVKQVELEDALETATKASRAKSTFLFNMSHDIRTPMNAIIGFTGLAIKNIDDKEKALDCLNKTKASSEHLLNLINDILDMSRIESGKLELNPVPLNILEIIDNQSAMATTFAGQKGVEFSLTTENIINKYVLADHLRLNQAVINILSNAVKYTAKDGKVDYIVREVESQKEGYAYFEFVAKDTGCGIQKDYLPYIFDEFSREKTSTVSKQQGTGLGLAITKQIVDLMGGEIKVESEVGVGTTFTLCIPLKIQANVAGVETVVPEILVYDEEILKDKRCLLVEDNVLNREIATDLLTEEGLVVECAEDGSVAVKLVEEKGPDYYDIILMDIQMPVMDGFEATKLIRALFPDKHIPIIALSANAFEEDRQKSIAMGMDDHQAKPIDMKELKRAISKLLSK